MKVEEGNTYKIEFVKKTDVVIQANEDPDMTMDKTYNKGDKDVVEIVEIDEGMATFFWNATTYDEIDTFAEDVPLSSFKAIAKRKVTWIKE